MALFTLIMRLLALFAATWGVFTDSTSMVAYGIFLLLWSNAVAWSEFAVQFAKALRRD